MHKYTYTCTYLSQKKCISGRVHNCPCLYSTDRCRLSAFLMSCFIYDSQILFLSTFSEKINGKEQRFKETYSHSPSRKIQRFQQRPSFFSQYNIRKRV